MCSRFFSGWGRQLIKAATGVALSALFGVSATAETPSADTLIRNVAEATYFDRATGVLETVRSNAVTALVLEAPSLDVSGSNYLRLTRGAIEAHYFTISNTGNVTIDFMLDIGLKGDVAALMPQGLWIDANSNGLVDPAETEVTGSVTLAMGEDLSLISTFQVATDAVPGDTVNTTLTVTPRSTVAGVLSATGVVEVVSRTLELRKSVTTAVTSEGTLLSYTLALRNDSEETVPAYSEIDGTPIRIDGNGVTGILVRDAVPVATVLARMGDTGGFLPLYHRRGDPFHEYLSAAPTSLGDVDAIAFLLSADYPVGRSTDLEFSVLLPGPVAPLEVRNTALTYVSDGPGEDTVTSNTVTTWVAARFESFLEFRAAVGGTLPQTEADIGTDTRLWLEAGACNRTDARDRVEIVVTSRITGDSERLTAIETAESSGIFATGPLALVGMDFPETMDGVMAVTEGDTLLAQAICEGVVTSAELPVTPGLFVFDSVTNAPVEGAVVSLLDSANVLFASVATDQNGYFTLGDMPAGDYRVEIALPAQYAFPSVRTVFWGFERDVDAAGSYGASFSHTGGHIDGVDIPVDPRRSVPISLEKTAAAAVAMPGGQMEYTVRGENRMDQALIGARLNDTLPEDSRLVPGTVVIDGVSAPDPVETAPGVLSFDVGDLLPRQSVQIAYKLRFSANADEGALVNVATLSGYQAGTALLINSSPARATVRLDASRGVLTREATIIGSVFMDCNGDGIRDGDSEPGVPGVKIITQQGISVVTDIHGKYSLVGLRPKSHVLSVRTSTLPEDTEVTSTRTLDLGRRGTRMVTLKKGELVAEHFALRRCTPDTLEEVETRVRIFRDRNPSASDLRGDLPFSQAEPDRRSARNEAGIATSTHILRSETEPRAGKARRAPEAPATLEALVKKLNPEADFLNLKDGEVLRRDVLSIRVKGKADLALSLSVNGTHLGGDRIGAIATWRYGNVQAAEFVAVRLKPGVNTLVLSGKDPFGIVRDKKTITVIAPGKPARLAIAAPESAMAAPMHRIPVVVSILDANGRPVEASGVVTLSANSATWDTPDIRPETPGHQVYVDNGEATVDLIPPQTTGIDILKAENSFGEAHARIAFKPNLEERVLVGIVEGAVSLNGRGDLVEQSEISLFENTAEGLNGELYYKGRIRGDALLTLRYSSDRDTSDRLFRDIRRDEYYPVYGDNAEHGFDAQSSGGLYVKVEKGQSYVLYGDIAIVPEMPAFRLGGVSRLTTGAKAHWEDETTRVTLFAARTDQSQKVSEIAGLGISGPYPVDLSGFREGSDRVELLVRDADSGEVISSRKLRRFDDYVLDFFADSILFDNPVPQADLDGNPVSVRVTFETHGGGERHWLYGGEISVDVSENTKIGLRTLGDNAPTGLGQRSRVTALALRSQLDSFTTFEAETANASTEAGGEGSALRFTLEQRFEHETVLIEASHTDRGFSPDGSPFRPGSDRITLEFSKKLSEELTIGFSSSFLSDRIAGTRSVEAEFEAKRILNHLTTTHAGLRLQRDLKAGSSTTYANFGANWRVVEESPFEFRLDIEAATHGDSEGTLEIGVAGEVSSRLSFSGLARIAADRRGEFDRVEQFVVGIEYDMTEWLQGASEVTADETGLNRYLGRLTQGLKVHWSPSEELTLRADLEHVQPLSDGEASSSVALAFDYLRPDERSMASAALERSWRSDARSTYLSLSIAERYDQDVTYLAQARYAEQARTGQPDHRRVRARIGASFRPKHDPRLEMLAWYEQQRESRASGTTTHRWSLQGTYEADADTRLNARYSGIKSQTDGVAGATLDSLTQLAQLGASFELADDRWILGVNASHVWDDTGFSTIAVGAEIGYAFSGDAVLTFGYSEGRASLPGSKADSSGGLYFRVSMVLSENLLSEFHEFANSN